MLASINTQHGVVTRFAPSPTGYMTIGNFRTALFSYLFAHKHQGVFLVRIEDTDLERSEQIYTDQLFNDLVRMGLQYDPTLVVHQSQRTHLYEEYYQKLINDGLVYPCYCSPDELALERKIQLAQSQPPRYSGRCRNLSHQECQVKEEAGIKPVLRFHVRQEKITFHDEIMGTKEFNSQDIGDFIIKKTDGQATFFFCNAIDDALTGVTHVLRGDDHLTNTPRQILLLQSLKLPIPAYGHFPLILGYDHKPLSKRTGSRSIKELLEEGYLPEAINNYLARLGHHLNSTELYSIQSIADHFTFDSIANSAAHFDQTQLDYWQKQAFARLNGDQARNMLQPYAQQVENLDAFWQLVHPNITKASELPLWIARLHQEQLACSYEQLSSYGWTIEHFEFLLQHWGVAWSTLLAGLKEKELKGKQLFMPLRLLMTGLEDGPPLEPLYQYMKHTTMDARIKETLRAAKAL
ncbi:glutamate--tRNA ligase [bacterium]|nr:glutamate--tRNA ligase [bacterium]NBW57004.1 glutamate--tRNA ligase [bacterium]NBX71963.1 glutamate--tRNA ligase [bacterium]